MFRYILVSLFSVCFLSNCVCRHSRLDQAMEFAGTNRAQLEAVLEHYKDDTLRLRAAQFLIENMPHYYSYKGDVLDSIKVADSIYLRDKSYDQSRFSYLFPVDFNSLERVYDSKVISADYLIENIDYAFKVWQNRPWTDQISFDTFCEYILPYRIANEPLTRWRKTLYNKYCSAFDSLCVGDSLTVACMLFEKYLRQSGFNYNTSMNVPHYDAIYLDSVRIGQCVDLCDYTQNAMRAVGLPIATDCYLYSPRFQFSHSWNVLVASSSDSYMLPITPGRDKVKRGLKYGKIYRNTFSLDDDEFYQLPEEDIPPLLCERNLRDVTHEFFPHNSILLDCSGHNNKYAMLGIFTIYGWQPIARAPIVGGQARFDNLENDILYIPLFYRGGATTSTLNPFILKADKMETIIPEAHIDSVRLTRKYPMRTDMFYYFKRIHGGEFQGANRADFSDAVSLYRVDHNRIGPFFEVMIDDSRAFKYLRYISAEKCMGDIATVAFFDEYFNQIQGRIFGSPPYKNDPSTAPQAAFDNDPLTYFTSSESRGYVALELATKRKVAKILYAARNDDNFVRINDTYELWSYVDCQWQHCATRQANDTVLVFNNIPSKSLLLLKNKSRGIEERPFLYIDGAQYFY